MIGVLYKKIARFYAGYFYGENNVKSMSDF